MIQEKGWNYIDTRVTVGVTRVSSPRSLGLRVVYPIGVKYCKYPDAGHSTVPLYIGVVGGGVRILTT